MQTVKSSLWQQMLSRLPIYRKIRRTDAKSVTAPLRTELLNDYLLRDLGLPARHVDLRHPRL